jgi:hypothetical protein
MLDTSTNTPSRLQVYNLPINAVIDDHTKLRYTI